MFKLNVKTNEGSILLLTVVGSNEQTLFEYGLSFASGIGYRRNEVEIDVTNFPEKIQRRSFCDRVINIF